MNLSEARNVCSNKVPNIVLSSITPNDVIEFEQAFAVLVDLQLTVSSLFFGGSKLSAVDAADIVKSTGIVKNILALKNNKNISKEQTLITVLARIALGRLQNVGDRYEIDYDKFTLGFKVVESVKPKYDSDGIIKEAGLTLKTEIINTDLSDCFKEASAPINPTGCLQAINDGKLDAKYKTDVSSTDILVEFNWKEVE